MPLFRGNAEDVISKLIAAIYDAALDPHKWQVFVDTIQQDLDGIEPVLYIADTKSAMMETLLVSQQWGEKFIAEYMAHYNAVNPWTPHLVNGPEIGQPIRGEEMMSPASLQRTEFYDDFFKHWVKWTGVVGVLPYRDSHAFSCLGLHCSQRSLDRHWQELDKLAAELSSHITHAFEISRQLQHGAARKASLELMLESFTSPALVIGADGRVRYANGAAEESLRSGTLSLDAQGRITAGTRTEETKALREALAAALSPLKRTAEPPVITLTQIRNGVGRAMPLTARMMPLTVGIDRKLDVPNPVPPVEVEQEVLLLIIDPVAKPAVCAQDLQRVFGLTLAEARLAQALAQGTSLQGYAAAAGITEGTARVQLKSIFDKTSTHRQADLIALLARLAQPTTLGN